MIEVYQTLQLNQVDVNQNVSIETESFISLDISKYHKVRSV